MSKKFKSIGSVFMAFCLSVTMSSTSLFAVVADAIEKNSVEEATQEDFKDASTNETEESKEASSEQSTTLEWYDPEKTSFTISSEDDLVLLSRIVNGTAEDAGGNKVQDSFKGKTIILKGDVDLSGVDMSPIGTKDLPFEGTFNGKDSSIKLDISSKESNQALFGYNKGTIKNLVLSGSVKGKEYVAGLVAVNEGKVQSIESSVEVTATGDYAGGIVASNDGTVDRCKNTGEIYAFRYTGGIVGINSYNVTKCSNSATIYCTGNDTIYDSFKGTGGITGASRGTVERHFLIEDCYNTGDILCGYTGGGITGWVENGVVRNCYNTGYCEGVWTIGGITGGLMEYDFENDYSLVENCYNYGKIHVGLDVHNDAHLDSISRSINYAGGIAGFMKGAKMINCYNAGDVYAPMQSGGMAGGNYNTTPTLIRQCINTGKVTGGSYVGPIVGWMNSGKNEECIGNLTFDNPTDEDFAKIVSELNSRVTDENGYYGWKYEDGKVSQARVYDVKFKVNPEDAKIVVKNSEGKEVYPVEENLYMLPNGDYTCEISKDGYKTKARTFSVYESDSVLTVKLIPNDSLWTGDEDTSWYDAEKDTFEISSCAQLAGLLKLVNEGNTFEGKTIKLTKD
ncbi:MAG: hypothetical protein ACI4PU_04145, partial [Intestinibacter sp.]